MKKLHRIALVLSHCAIFTSAITSSSILNAQKSANANRWTLDKDEHNCSLSQIKKDSFIFLSLSAERHQLLRFHNSSWRLNVGDSVQVDLSVAGRTFHLSAIGASTSNGWRGFTASPQEDVISALSAKGPASISIERGPPITVDLSGLHEGIPILMECVAPLKKRDSTQIAVRPPRLLQQPSISRDDLPRNDKPNGPLTYQLAVSADGIVTGCSIIMSSGSAHVDARICTLLQERAKFEAALNDAGQPISSTFRSRIGF